MASRKHRDLTKKAKAAHYKRKKARQLYLRIIATEQGGLCASCGCEMMMELIGIGHEWTGDVDTRPTIDHVIDIEYGGTNEKDNLRVVCYRCNQTKNDRKNEERYENEDSSR